MLVPNASSPTRSLCSSVWQYVPELALQIGARAARGLQASAGDLEPERRGAQVAALRTEVVARGPVAHEDAVHARRRREDFCRQADSTSSAG